jgi:hypothetical protein
MPNEGTNSNNNNNVEKILEKLLWIKPWEVNNETKKELDTDKTINAEIDDRFSGMNKRISELYSKTVKLQDKLKESQKLLNSQIKHTKRLEWLVVWLIILLVITIIWWIKESIFEYGNIKKDYIVKTQEVDRKLKLIEKDLEIYKLDNATFKEEFKKEVELQLLKKIIELKINN